jgi:hypothetical protein
MRPMFYQVLEQMPYTANGKVDRQALLLRPLALAAQQHLQPQTATEHRLREVWSELLELPRPISPSTTASSTWGPLDPAVAPAAGSA